jgi:hypothetical protein
MLSVAGGQVFFDRAFRPKKIDQFKKAVLSLWSLIATVALSDVVHFDKALIVLQRVLWSHIFVYQRMCAPRAVQRVGLLKVAASNLEYPHRDSRRLLVETN